MLARLLSGLGVAVALIVASSHAGQEKIETRLQAEMRNASSIELLDVIITLRDQVNLPELEAGMLGSLKPGEKLTPERR